ncbi:MAG: Y-family DNA polymerase [Litorivicinaceae bacterium]
MTALFAQLTFPALALEVLDITPDAPATVVYAGSEVVAANLSAQRHGLSPGMTVSLAQTLCPEVHTCVRRPERERQWLHHWAHWAYGYSHQVAIRHGGLCLEIASSQRLLGDIPAILAQLNAPHQDAQRPIRLATGLSPEMADLFLSQGLCPAPEDYVTTLHASPIQTLPIDHAQHQRMHRMGLRTLGELLALSQRDRLRRFSPELETLLQAITGQQVHPLPWFKPPVVFARTLEFDPGLATEDSLRFPMRRLLQDACQWLRLRQSATDQLCWQLTDASRQTHRLQVQLNQPEHGLDVLSETTWLTLARWRLPSAVYALTLRIDRLSRHTPTALDLFQARPTQAWRHRLTARLGPACLQWPTRVQDPRPEEANRYTTTPTEVSVPAHLPLRPLWLVDPPEPLGSGQVPLGHQLLRGPERLESGWWDHRPIQRAYWVSQTEEQRHAWVYQDRTTQHWWLAGWFN